MRTPIETRCSVCSTMFPSAIAAFRHRKAAHPETYRPRKANLKDHHPEAASPEAADSALDLIRQHERLITKLLLELDTERQKLHDRIVEIDNITTKYRKFQAGQ